MITASQIKPETSVVCSKDVELGVVDHMEGGANIKLKKDQAGVHHYIPLSWVTKVDSKIHLDRPGAEAKQAWQLSVPPGKPAAQAKS
jgi:hypothetical protein